MYPLPIKADGRFLEESLRRPDIESEFIQPLTPSDYQRGIGQSPLTAELFLENSVAPSPRSYVLV
jgi:hypothetical protein